MSAEPWFDFHAVARPAGRFTGDFYLTAPSDDGLWIALGDVAGKGLGAALVSSLAQEVLEPRMQNGARPVDLVRAVHESLTGELRPPHLYLTLVVGHLHRSGRLRLVNAAHPPPFLVVPGRRAETVAPHGPLVGVFPGSRWSELDRLMGPGEALIVYSDGLPEATTPRGGELGVPRLREAAERRAGAPDARALARGLLRDATPVHANGTAHDDATVLVLRR